MSWRERCRAPISAAVEERADVVGKELGELLRKPCPEYPVATIKPSTSVLRSMIWLRSGVIS